MRKFVPGIASLWLAACAAEPLFESYTPKSGEDVSPPPDSIQYFLPRRLVAVTVQRTRTPRDAVSIRLLTPVPDPAQPYYVRTTRRPWRDTTTHVSLSASGLLNSIGASSKDQSSAILADAVSLAALAPELAAAPGALGIREIAPLVPPEGLAAAPPAAPCGSLAQGLKAASAPPPMAFKATVVFDPADPAELARAEAELCTRGAHYRFVTIPVAPGSTIAPTSDRRAACRHSSGAGLTCEAGVYYRRDQPFVIGVYDGGSGAGPPYTLVSAALIQMPNLAPRQRLAFSAPPGVATRASATFADGMLLSANLDAPSSARALAALPLDLARSIVSIPSALFQFRIESARDAARLTEAQTEAIKAQTAQLRAWAALQSARSDEEVRAEAEASDSVSFSPDPNPGPK